MPPAPTPLRRLYIQGCYHDRKVNQGTASARFDLAKGGYWEQLFDPRRCAVGRSFQLPHGGGELAITGRLLGSRYGFGAPYPLGRRLDQRHQLPAWLYDHLTSERVGDSVLASQYPLDFLPNSAAVPSRADHPGFPIPVHPLEVEQHRSGAGPAFQYRDLRAKAGTDKADTSSDTRQAQPQLVHSSVVMTET